MSETNLSTGNLPADLYASHKNNFVTVVGAGLAGSECAWQLAERGHKVKLIEMRGTVTPKSTDLFTTPAHKTQYFSELVCSNSLGSQTDYSAPGQLKWEATHLNSLILKSAHDSAIPAGMALGVDRELFAKLITESITRHPNIEIVRTRIDSLEDIPRPAVIATGPLTHDSLAQSILQHLSYGEDKNDFLYFFDAIAPIIDVDTINMDIAWKGNRYDRSESTQELPSDSSGDYINCPMTKDQYFKFIDAVRAAKIIEPKDFEKIPYFEGCMPIEVMVERGPLTPKFGPMSPNGLRNPETGEQPYAVVQLRQDNREGTAYNMVGFQTKMAYADQKQVFRLIPGLENAEFLKLGSIHRNMYIHTPRKLSSTLTSRRDSQLYFAGQITGVEGYFDSTCIGLLVALFVDAQLNEKFVTYKFTPPPRATALGSLLNAITEPKEKFQPTNINFGLFPNIELEPEAIAAAETAPQGEPLTRAQKNKNRQQSNANKRERKREQQIKSAKAAFLEWHSNLLKK